MTAAFQSTRWCGPCCGNPRGHCSQAHGGSAVHTHTPRPLLPTPPITGRAS